MTREKPVDVIGCYFRGALLGLIAGVALGLACGLSIFVALDYAMFKDNIREVTEVQDMKINRLYIDKGVDDDG